MKLRSYLVILATLMILCVFSGCSNSGNVGRTCMGDDLDTLFEGLPWEARLKAKKGDVIATKNPGLWLDFNYPVAFNQYNTAFGKFAGLNRKIVTESGKVMTIEEYAKFVEKRQQQKNK